MSFLSVETDELLRHAAWVRQLAGRLVADAQGADDAAQETMMAALRRPPSRAVDLRRWLAAVLRNNVRIARRAGERRRRRERQAAVSERLPATSDLVEKLSMHRALVEEVQQLDEPYRTTILLRYFEGRSLREVARDFAVPVSTVSSRLRKAEQTLRDRLDRRAGSRRAWVSALVPRGGGSGLATGVRGSWFATRFALSSGLLVAGLVGWSAFAAFGPAGPPAASPKSGGSAAAVVLPRDLGGTPREDLRLPRQPAVEPLPSIHGRVVDVDGGALVGIGVVLVASGPEDRFPGVKNARGSPSPRSERPVLGRTTSAANGRFELRGEDRVDGRILVDDGSWQTVLAGVSWRGLTRDRVVVAAPSAAVAGAVLGPSGRPFPGATVRLVLPEGLRSRLDEVLDYSVELRWQVTTDAAGEFVLADVPVVEGAVVEVVAAGHASLRRSFERALADGRFRFARRENTETLGRVVDARGMPCAAARVVHGRRVVAETDPQGGFRFAAAAEADELTALVPGYLPATGSAQGDEVALVVARPLPRIRGTVVGAGGAPVAGAWVWIANPTVVAEDGEDLVVAEAVLGEAASSWSVAVADRRGGFELPCLDRGDYVLRTSRPGSSRFGEVSGIAGGATGVAVRYPTDEVVPVVRGRVVDYLGRPLAGVLVSASRDSLVLPSRERGPLRWRANGPSEYTDEAGRFALRDVPREAGLYASSPDLLDRSVPPEALADPLAVEIVALRVCHLRVEAPSRGPETPLSFAVVDGDGVEVELRLHYGIGSKPVSRCPLVEGRSGAVGVAETGREVVLYAGSREVARTSIRLAPGTTERVVF